MIFRADADGDAERRRSPPQARHAKMALAAAPRSRFAHCMHAAKIAALQYREFEHVHSSNTRISWPKKICSASTRAQRESLATMTLSLSLPLAAQAL